MECIIISAKMANIQIIILTSFAILTAARVMPIEKGINYFPYASEAFLKNYFNQRSNVIEGERSMSISGRINLINAKEVAVNKLFMKWKEEELKIGFEEPDKNIAGMHFFKAKEFIKRSKVYRFIKTMPKGAILHVHNSAAVSSKWFLKNLTHTPGLMRCVNGNNVTILTFQKNPTAHNCTDYREINEERKLYKNSQKYEEFLGSSLSIYTPNPEEEYRSINAVWTRFQNIFTTVKEVIRYLPTFRPFHKRLLEELYKDNIMYCELRVNFRGLRNATHKLSEEEYLMELLNIVNEFKRTHPNFLGLKVIYTRNRNINSTELQRILEAYKKLEKKFENFLIGFDMGGQEDTGFPTKNFVSVLADPKLKTRYFFHSGETNWYGAKSDLNLVDSMLLNATRIGHAYALLKHPIVRKRLKEKDIAVEICPISNQVLKLVSDLRNHPAAYYMTENLPMVISSDDPGFWGARGLSYDYYFAIMSFASISAGIETLKQLALNSIKYSVLTTEERRKANKMFKKQWKDFIDFWYKRSCIKKFNKK